MCCSFAKCCHLSFRAFVEHVRGLRLVCVSPGKRRQKLSGLLFTFFHETLIFYIKSLFNVEPFNRIYCANDSSEISSR